MLSRKLDISKIALLHGVVLVKSERRNLVEYDILIYHFICLRPEILIKENMV